MASAIEELQGPTLGDISLPDPPRCIPHTAPRGWQLRARSRSLAASILGTCFSPRETKAFGILAYHRVCDLPENYPAPTWNVTPERFERQLAGLLARGWQAWPLRQVVSCAERDWPIPRKVFVVTFNFGYANCLIHAAPVLAKHHIPATLFLATAQLDSKNAFPSDDWAFAGQLGVPSETWRPLTTDECKRLTANGLIELGAFTHSHADFRKRPDALVSDLNENLTVLRKQFGVENPPFAFPYGTKADRFVTPELASAARDTGVVACLSAEPGLVRPGDSPFDWGRFCVQQFDTAGSLAGKLGGWDN
jgi:peptidoglycan/xylan/chitin deacetylase (PgdA/CDA1 family)